MPYTQDLLDAMSAKNPPSGVRNSAQGLDTMEADPARAKKALAKFKDDYEEWTNPHKAGWAPAMHLAVFKLTEKYKKYQC